MEALARSLDRCGQLVPCLVVASGDDGRLILVDGYRRITPLKRLGRDTARVEPFPGDLADALIAGLTRAHAHPFAAIEEALLMRELHEGQGVSQHELAHRLGRDVSWVQRGGPPKVPLPPSLGSPIPCISPSAGYVSADEYALRMQYADQSPSKRSLS